jgi:hypothetical protein
VGELATIPICPAITGAYYERDGQLRTRLPIDNSFYRKEISTGKKIEKRLKED